MSRQRSEVRVFTMDEIYQLAMSAAKLEIIGGFYKGEFIDQTAEWQNTDLVTLAVTTTHIPEESQ